MNVFHKIRKWNWYVSKDELFTRYRSGSCASIIIQRICNAGLWTGAAGKEINIIARFSITCYVITLIAQLIELFQARNDSEKLFECVSVLSFCGVGFLKLNSLFSRREYWLSLINQASSLENEELETDPANVDYESDEDQDNGFQRPIQSYTDDFLSTSNLLSRMYIFTFVVFCLSPFIEYGLYSYQGEENLKPPHILPCWSPLDGLSLLCYFFAIFAEIVAALFCVFVHIAFDLSAVGLMIHARGQFTLLHNYSENIAGKGREINLLTKRDVRAHFRIIKCHRIHVSVIRLLNEFEDVIRNILGIYFFVATITLCSVALRITSENLSIAQLLSLLQYTGATLTQLFLFCHYGDAVLNESVIGLGEGPFCAASWCVNPRIRREMALLGAGMARRRWLRAGPFFSLDLPSFIQILRTAYSYYALLAQMRDR